MGWLIAALVVSFFYLLGWAICRAAARADAEEAHRNLLGLLADEVRERADADAISANLDI